MTPLPRRLFAEFLGTALLLATVVGSGVMGMELSGGNRGVALLANAGATAAALYVLIVLLGPVSGAHMNPAVSLVARLRGELDARTLAGYVLAQVAGAVAGVALAHLMFGLDVVQWGDHARTGASQWLSEAVATAGLVLTIVLGLRQRAAAVPALVAAYIFAAYWFTASTSFANPAVTLARSITRTFAGIRPVDVPGFVIAQLAGALLGLAMARALAGDDRRVDRPQ
ncbi:aquaporin [Lysobacter sp. N42]|uniref:aquaporin n=1 Tax=Lysobacter sp. N42 TaxID=2545719 RepID=UPI001047DF6F|nr:aquaporin [Lysobacter sp. N42]TCZ78392.1 aquaporin family protein [Lysobacter sp. N42]